MVYPTPEDYKADRERTLQQLKWLAMVPSYLWHRVRYSFDGSGLWVTLGLASILVVLSMILFGGK